MYQSLRCGARATKGGGGFFSLGQGGAPLIGIALLPVTQRRDYILRALLREKNCFHLLCLSRALLDGFPAGIGKACPLLMSTRGLSMPYKNTIKRHATWLTHVAHPLI